MDILIREAILTDAEALCRLNREALGYDYPLSATAGKLATALTRPSEKIFVAVQEKQVVGYVHAQDYDVLYAPHYKDVLGLAVAPDCRRQGAGRALMAAVEDWARAGGAVAVRLVSGMGRTGAHAFYRRCGYDGGKQQINFKKKL